MEGEQDHVWQTCCSKSSSSFLHYVSQLVVTTGVLSLSIGMLAAGSKDTLYPSLLMLILGVYLPTPTHKNTPSVPPPPDREPPNTHDRDFVGRAPELVAGESFLR